MQHKRLEFDPLQHRFFCFHNFRVSVAMLGGFLSHFCFALFFNYSGKQCCNLDYCCSFTNVGLDCIKML